MVKISDIFRKDSPSPDEKPKDIAKPAPRTEPFQYKPAAPPPAPETQAPKEPSQIMKDKLKIEDKQATRHIYQDTIDLVNEILQKGRNNEPIEIKRIKDHVEKLANQLCLGNSELLTLIKNSTPENYLLGHSVNICILSIVVALGLNFDREKLIELGVAALLHDIGMIRVSDLADKPDKLSQDEYEKIKEHPIFGVEILGLSKDISQSVIYVTQEHHELTNGKGYPKGLKGKQINEYAKIVGTVDMYEALTHPRAHRDKLIPFDAMRHLLKNKEHFVPEYLKVLIEQVGIYPLGSWIELSNGEIGRVIKINRDNPLRPVVDIVFDPQGKKLTGSKCVDLTRVANLHVKDPVDENELHL